MKSISKWAAGHKKIVTALLTAIVALIPADVLDADSKKELVGIGVAFILGQGVADAGKEAKKIEVAGKLAAVDAANSPGAIPAMSQE